MSSRRVIVMAAAIVAIVCSCSTPQVSSPPGSSLAVGGAAATTVPDSTTLFLRQANAICRDMKTKGAALTASASSISDAAKLPPLFDEMAGVVNEAVTRLRALTPPPTVAAGVTTGIEALARSADEATTLSAAARAGDQAGLKAAYQRQAQAQQASDDAMRAVGLTDCALG